MKNILDDYMTDNIGADRLCANRINSKLENDFKYHSPKEGQPEKYTAIREKTKQLAYLIEDLCPNSREKSLAITKLEEATMWANASIARNE